MTFDECTIGCRKPIKTLAGGWSFLTTVNPADRPPDANYYVVNFKDYRFLQVFYPTQGVLAWYSRESGQREPLPGADDPGYVQTDGVWSPDGSYVVFARAEARPAEPPDGKMAAYANDPNEVQIQYNLCRVPFDGGRGGTAEAIAGAPTMHEQYIPESIAGRALDRFCQMPQWAIDASRRPALDCAGGGRASPAYALQHAAHELLAQLFA